MTPSNTTHPNRAAFPPGVSGPALRALARAGIRSLAELASWSDADLAALHGIGPKALAVLRAAAAAPLPTSMVTGKASAAKAADGEAPVFAYLASVPQPQRALLERVDALAAETLPNLARAVKWGIAYYGVGDGWCFCCGAFADHVKLMFINGTSLTPVPPVTPVAMGKATRGVELTPSDRFDARQLAEWMRQATAMPGVGKRKG